MGFGAQRNKYNVPDTDMRGSHFGKVAIGGLYGKQGKHDRRRMKFPYGLHVKVPGTHEGRFVTPSSDKSEP